MKKLLTASLLSLLLAGCYTPPTIPQGTPEADVIARFGKPDIVYNLPDGAKLFEWTVGEALDSAYMARIGADGNLVWYKNVRTDEQFALIKPGVSTMEDVKLTCGTPTETEYLPMKDVTAWTYRYREDTIWHSMMHIIFDRNGKVVRMETGPDPMFIPE